MRTLIDYFHILVYTRYRIYTVDIAGLLDFIFRRVHNKFHPIIIKKFMSQV